MNIFTVKTANLKYLFSPLIFLMFLPIASGSDDGVIAWWSFDKIQNRNVIEHFSGINDTIEGNFKLVGGVNGRAIKLDGFTSVVRHPEKPASALKGSFSAEAWIALASYPWNWCPIITQMKDDVEGYSLEIGPRGEFALKIFIAGNPVVCVSEKAILPLRKWAHIASVYEEGFGIKIFLNGSQIGEYLIKGKPVFSKNSELRIGMNYHAVKPSNQIGDNGTLPYWFSIDGILDEIKIFDRALTNDQVSESFSSVRSIAEPALELRRMPSGDESQKRFGAYYTQLKYYDEWDALWPVASDPDIVVTFDKSPVRVVFWRGTRFSPAWVTDNKLWMCDQSVEAWNDGEGCFEHMEDPQCRYSHVRIIEDSPARKVIHWRYAPVSAHNNLWRVDVKTKWGVWVDEYYYIYPDASAIRKVTWKSGTLGYPRQFQESLPLTHPGQLQGDVIEPDYVEIANMQGEKQTFSYIPDPPEKKNKIIPVSPNIQKHNLKSLYDPFIIFEPGDKMDYLKDLDIKALSSPGSCNHWPVGMAFSDGRRSQAADNPSHFLGFPISDPVIHSDQNSRDFWYAIYGMTTLPLDELIEIGKSWVSAPPLTISRNSDFEGGSYDMSQKAYVLRRKQPESNSLKMKIHSASDSSLYNPAFVIEGWGEKDITLKINGKEMEQGKDFRSGHVFRMGSTNLILWLDIKTNKEVEVEIL
jgi:hypothetical protein